MTAPCPAAVPERLAAVLWDFDGTLADTEPLWIAAEYELVAELGGQWNHEHAEQLVGNALVDSAAYLLGVVDRPDLTPDWVVGQLLRRVVHSLQAQPVPWRPGALDLLKSFAAAQIPCALVSASYRVLLDAALSQLPPGSFRASVAGDEVSQGKPHPEPYERACRELGVAPGRCVVIEDSPPGANSGNAAGAVVLAVPNVVPIPDAPRRIRVGSLTDLDVRTVVELFEQADA